MSLGVILLLKFDIFWKRSQEMRNWEICGANTNSISAINMTKDENEIIKLRKNLLSSFSPSLLNTDENKGIMAAFNDPAITIIKRASGMVKAAQKISNS